MRKSQSPSLKVRIRPVIFWSLVICHLAFLTGCGDDQANSPVIASGFIEGEEVRIASEVGGTIAEIAVSEGDEVEAGQVLVRLDDALLQTRRGEALAAVTAAEANLARVRAGARSAELSAARAVLAEAQARRDGALTALEHARRELRNPQELNSLIVEAETQVALAEQEVERARADVGRAEFLYEVYADGDGDAERTRSLEVEAARAALEGAQARMEGALRYLSMLNAIRDEPLELEAQVHAAEAEFNAAEAVVAVAQASVEELEAGSTPEEIELAQAQLHQARASLTLIEAQMAQLTITSPITGMVTSRSTHAGETAAPGTTLLTLANLDQVTLVIYVPEAQVGHVRVGQPVEVAADSFPERAFVGTVTTIAGEAEFTPRNVQTREERVNLVFAVKVVIPNPDHALKPGMTADAVIRP